MSFLLDTNVISELRKPAKRDANVAAWYASIDGLDLYLSVLVTGEIRNGIERARKRDLKKAQVLQSWLAGLHEVFRGRILPITGEVADEWGRLNALRPISTVDGLLAATAKVHRQILVTRNTKDVVGLGIKVLNPFKPSTS